MKKSIYCLVLFLSILLSSCRVILDKLPGVYTLDIQQGNVIDQVMIDQLKPNMSKRQVVYIMGTSMLKDTFHEERWDYLSSRQKGREQRKQKRLSLFFDNDKLIRIQGDLQPRTLSEQIESRETTIEVPPRHNIGETLWEEFSSIFVDDEPKTSEPIITNEDEKAAVSQTEN